jgi:hypothetical protein
MSKAGKLIFKSVMPKANVQNGIVQILHIFLLALSLKYKAALLIVAVMLLALATNETPVNSTLP